MSAVEIRQYDWKSPRP